MNTQKTTLRQNITNDDRQWFVLDASEKTLGKVAATIADVLMGKSKVDFTPHTDGGDYVVVLNAEKISVGGNKETQKVYQRHSGYLGKLKSQTLQEMRTKNPTKILLHAVSGMLPKNKHRDDRLKRLRLVVGSENPYEAQKPTPLAISL